MNKMITDSIQACFILNIFDQSSHVSLFSEQLVPLKCKIVIFLDVKEDTTDYIEN